MRLHIHWKSLSPLFNNQETSSPPLFNFDTLFKSDTLPPPISYNLAGFLGMLSPIQKPKKVFAPFFKNRKKCVPTVGKLGPGTRQVLPPSLRTFTDFHFFHLWLIDCGSKEEKYRGILPHLRWVLFRSRIEGWYGRKWIKTPGLDLDCPKKLPDTNFFWVSESIRLRYITLFLSKYIHNKQCSRPTPLMLLSSDWLIFPPNDSCSRGFISLWFPHRTCRHPLKKILTNEKKTNWFVFFHSFIQFHNNRPRDITLGANSLEFATNSMTNSMTHAHNLGSKTLIVYHLHLIGSKNWIQWIGSKNWTVYQALQECPWSNIPIILFGYTIDRSSW